MTSASESTVEGSRGVRNRGLPLNDTTIDPKQAAQNEAERLKALVPGTYRHPDGSPPARQDFEAFSRQYDQMANERHVWRFARPDGSTYETSWRGLGTGTTAQASADLVGHRVIGEVIPRSTVKGTPTQDADRRGPEPRLTPPPLVQAARPYSPPPLVQAEPAYSPPPLVQAEPPFEPLPWPYSNRIDNDERGIAPGTRALTRSAEKKSGSPSSTSSQLLKKPGRGSLASLEQEIEKYRDTDPPPRTAAEKLKPVHNVTTEHQEKVRDLVNWAIQAATLEAKPGTEANVILKDAQDKVARLRNSKISDAQDNLIYRDSDHYLAARSQEFMVKTAIKMHQAGLMSTEAMLSIAFKPPSSETNKAAVGPWGINQLYETAKLQQFAQEARSLGAGVPGTGVQFGLVGDHPAAAGGTEWELLGMIDFERYDANGPKTVPHPLVDLPGKGERFAKSPEVPAYLREEAKRIVGKMEPDAKLTK